MSAPLVVMPQSEEVQNKDKQTKTLSILLTGFEPFGHPRPPTNPSWELLKPLNNTEIELEGRRIQLHCRELPVVYEKAKKMVFELHRTSRSTANLGDASDADLVGYDMYIHIGQGGLGSVFIEQQARNGPYSRQDNDQHIPSHPYCEGLDGDDNSKYPLHTYHPVYRTRIDVLALHEWLTKERSWPDVRISEDPGLYLCEYVYYHSLHVSHAMSNTTEPVSSSLGDKSEKPVLFIHVPTPKHPFTIDQLTALVNDAVYWLAEHYLK
ncbi:hypothetical protein BDF19DRAFT_451336 [Syncephalis fuscata]|nr:hypothetical protein BDF19DRAFT_451336 [Syncephalis fuscata]